MVVWMCGCVFVCVQKTSKVVVGHRHWRDIGAKSRKEEGCVQHNAASHARVLFWPPTALFFSHSILPTTNAAPFALRCVFIAPPPTHIHLHRVSPTSTRWHLAGSVRASLACQQVRHMLAVLAGCFVAHGRLFCSVWACVTSALNLHACALKLTFCMHVAVCAVSLPFSQTYTHRRVQLWCRHQRHRAQPRFQPCHRAAG